VAFHPPRISKQDSDSFLLNQIEMWKVRCSHHIDLKLCETLDPLIAPRCSGVHASLVCMTKGRN
jgi:hypothetical protein